MPCPIAYLATIRVPCLLISYSISVERSNSLTVPAQDLCHTKPTVVEKSPAREASEPCATPELMLEEGRLFVGTIFIPATFNTLPSL